MAFRERQFGPVIGKRSWGGVIGIVDHGPLLDGGRVFVPEYGNTDAAGHWIIEGHGVDPDIVVDARPRRGHRRPRSAARARDRGITAAAAGRAHGTATPAAAAAVAAGS